RNRQRRRGRGIEPAGGHGLVAAAGLGARIDQPRGEPNANRRALRLVTIRGDVHDLADRDGDAGFLERLARRCLAHVLVPLDVAARQAPEPGAEMPGPALHQQDASGVVPDDDGGAAPHCGEEDEAEGVAARPRQAAAQAAPERRPATRTDVPVVAEDHPQSLGTSYRAISGSWVTIVSRSSMAWATRRRSKGSRWWAGKLESRTVWETVMGSSSRDAARMARTTAATSASIFPSDALIAISQVLTALTYTSVSGSRMLLATRVGSRRGLLNAQISACVSSRSRVVTGRRPRRGRGRRPAGEHRNPWRRGSSPGARP